MLDTVFEFFGILDLNAPQNMGELIVLQMQLSVGLALVGGAFGVLKSIANIFRPGGWM